VDLKSAIVVLNEAEFPEFIHEKVDSGARCANHFRQHLLGNFGKHLSGWGSLPYRASSKRVRASRFSLELKS